MDRESPVGAVFTFFCVIEKDGVWSVVCGWN
jgi:hypothetical protein